MRIPIEQALVADLALERQLVDPAIRPSRSNIVPALRMPEVGAEMNVGAEMFVERNGGSLNWVHGRQTSDCGWWVSYVTQTLQHWRGWAHHMALKKAEVAWSVQRAQSEARAFRFHLGGKWRYYTCDLEVIRTDGAIEIIELKANERNLKDPDYRLTLAGVAEICRRVGMRFRLVLADELFADRHHRHNVELFASRRFAHVSTDHIRRLEGHAMRNGPETTYGELASLLQPDWPVAGKAVIQALLVRRRVKIDLTGLVSDSSPVTIH